MSYPRRVKSREVLRHAERACLSAAWPMWDCKIVSALSVAKRLAARSLPPRTPSRGECLVGPQSTLEQLSSVRISEEGEKYLSPIFHCLKAIIIASRREYETVLAGDSPLYPVR